MAKGIKKMKLAEALIDRADCQKRIEQLKQRLTRSAKVQEGEEPPEDPKELLKELERTLDTLTDLVKKINKTNAVTEIRPGMTLTDALAERDSLMLKRNVLTSLIESAAVTPRRYGRAEIKLVSTIKVGEIQKQTDDLARRHRELDSRIQETNWNVELIE